ncbi:Histone-lysine N-methyltransferase PRDM16 [Frankliniella fusca]|uniref:Histone-lysine N-methyltransferase PRDM16 n=1 Tax=Frankliniella fusca TaxID=407009 RepID=A0AAE1I4F0_9NEOP|nr:Histone-lysine N-methyltransferase PRDM16 [Frankliniella fusca]
MFCCCVCTKQFDTVANLIRHLQCFHHCLDSYECKQPGCIRILSSRESFQNHLTTKHTVVQSVTQPCRPSFTSASGVDVNVDCTVSSTENSDTFLCSTRNSNTSDSEISDVNSTENSVPHSFPVLDDDTSEVNITAEQFQVLLSKSALMYVAGLYQYDSVTRSFVQTIIDDHKKIFKQE